MFKRKFLPAIEGRTFIAGDFHGSFSRVQKFMEFIGFDKTKDRMLSVGDLVDRGPDSMNCLRLINEPWFHCVRGNHEQMMYDSTNYSWWSIWQRNGGQWAGQFEDREEAELNVLADKVKDMPVMLTVTKKNGLQYHVIHAELYMPDNFTDYMLDDPEIFDEVTSHQSMDGDYVIWGRGIFGPAYSRNMENKDTMKHYVNYLNMHGVHNIFDNHKLSHIYCGHSVVQKPLRVYGQTNLDTGAYRSYDVQLEDDGFWRASDKWAGLTFTEPETDKFWIVKEDGVHEIEPIVIA